MEKTKKTMCQYMDPFIQVWKNTNFLKTILELKSINAIIKALEHNVKTNQSE